MGIKVFSILLVSLSFIASPEIFAKQRLEMTSTMTTVKGHMGHLSTQKAGQAKISAH